MTPIGVLVVDDEALARRRAVRIARQLSWVGTIQEAGNSAQALECLTREPADILLLDIQMPGGHGFALIPQLPHPAPAVILVTAFDHYACRAFEAQAIDYVTKPIEPGRLHAAMERARIALGQRDTASRIAELEEVVANLRRTASAAERPTPELWVRQHGEYVRLALATITHIEAERDYSRIHANGNSYLYPENLASLERNLPAEEFIRIHRSAIVRLDAIVRVRTGKFSSLDAVLRGGTELRVGRTFTASIRARLSRALG